MTEYATAEGQLLGRAARIGRVLTKYAVRDRRLASGNADLKERAASLRRALEELGPTFAKLGQILSTRPDLLPPEFVEELAKLQDDVQPLTEAEVVSVMEEELGVPWEDVFETIDPEPLAAGTIGQVHRATLAGGERVVVKVQRPDARDQIMRDLGLLELLAERMEGRDAFRQIVDLPAVIEHLSESLKRELDSRQEAANLKRMREVLAPYPRIAVPAVYEQLSTDRLLVMEEVEGVPLREAPEGTARREAARQLLESYYRQILTEGFFHGDPHPGNLMWWKDSIYFLDFGMVGEVAPEVRELMLLLLMAFSHEDTPFLAEILLLLGGEDPPQGLDVQAFEAELEELLGRYRTASLADIELGAVLQGLTEIATRHRVRLPASLAMTGKALAQMQLATAELDPTLDPFAIAGRFVLRTLAAQMRLSADPKELVYDVQKLKVRATRFVESVERLTGARPGARLQVEMRGTEALEGAIRRGTRRLALAVTGGAAVAATGFTAGSDQVGAWLPIALGSAGAAVVGFLFLDLFVRKDG